MVIFCLFYNKRLKPPPACSGTDACASPPLHGRALRHAMGKYERGGVQWLTRCCLACIMSSPQAGRAIAVLPRGESRKVRTPQGTTPGKPRDGAICRNGPQKTTAGRSAQPPHTRQRVVMRRSGCPVMVKRWRKRPPAPTAMWAARQPPSGARSNRDDGAARSTRVSGRPHR